MAGKTHTSPIKLIEYRSALDEQVDAKYKSSTTAQSQDHALSKSQQETFFFGKPGAGAPIRDAEGNTIAKYSTSLDLKPKAVVDPSRSQAYAKVMKCH
jgi:hypothetical protein